MSFVVWMWCSVNICRYVVTCDPVGAKIGNGGATMHVLEELKRQIDPEELHNGNNFFLT